VSRFCIIPARGGSKRIPRKNIKPFHGIPIINYSIAAARDSQLFDGIWVSTEDREIAAIVNKYWEDVALVVLRPDELADDKTGTQAVMRHALTKLEAGWGDEVCCLYATAPMVTPQDIRLGHTCLTKTEWNPTYAFAVTTFPFPVQRALSRRSDGAIWPVWSEHADTRSQDLEEHWHDAGQWYWGRASAFLREEQIYAPASIGVPIPRWRVQDIDTEEDWIRAELMYAALVEGGKRLT